MILQAIRSLLFYLLFLGQTVILAIVLGTQVKIVKRRTGFGWAIAQYWGNSNLFFLRWIVGIRTRVTGTSSRSCRIPTGAPPSSPRRS